MVVATLIGYTVLPHESDRSRKPLFEIGETGQSDVVETDSSKRRHRAAMRNSSSGQAMVGRWRSLNHDNSRSCGGE
jgi:hypothetical protein